MAEARAWLIAGTPGALTRAAPLVEAHRAARPVRIVELDAGPTDEWWVGQLRGVRAVVVLTDPALPSVEAVPGTHLPDGEELVPVGVVEDDPAGVAASALALVHSRAAQRLGAGPVVVLGSREERARALAGRLVETLSDGRLPVRRLTAERLGRLDLTAALGLGPGAALYVGQGHALGWGGYGGVQAWQLDVDGPKPLGALLSLTCHAASRSGGSRSFIEEVVWRGLAAAALGAAGSTPHLANAALAVTVAERLAGGARTVADALPRGAPELHCYRIAGDPLAPFVGARGSRAGVSRIFAPAPGDELPPVSWSPPTADVVAA